MKPFLKQVAEFLFNNYKDQISDIKVVLPNKRASLYLSHYLSELTSKPIWLPTFYSIEDFIFHFSGLKNVNQNELLFELYNVHIQLNPNESSDFEQFISWAPLILKDFNEIDSYLIDAISAFRYLSDAKRLSVWNLDSHSLTESELRYLSFYSGLEHYYRQFKRKLFEEKIAYDGMAARYLAENCQSVFKTVDSFVFVGFNALSPAEKQIIDFCKKNCNALILWDIDAYYFDDEIQEAGKFLRKELATEKKKDILWWSDNLMEGEKNITIYPLAGNVLQTKIAAGILSNQISDNPISLNDWAIVLADENLLIPMINSFPEEIGDFNLTMSYPAKGTLIYDLVFTLFDALIHAKTSSSGNLLIYHTFIEKILRNTLIANCLNTGNKNVINESILRKIKSVNKVYISFEEINEWLDENSSEDSKKLIKILCSMNTGFNKSGSVNDAKHLFTFFYSLFNHLNCCYTESVFQKAYINELYNLFQRIEILTQRFPFIQNIKSLKKILKINLQSLGIPFSGEPLVGVQLMGLLETRLLDFKNIIVLSANEGILPKSSPYQSFLLFDIKRDLGMPLPQDNEAIFSYHFYRLIQRAQNIHILYNTVPNELGGGEPSQFLRQLMVELPKKNKNIRIEIQEIDFPLDALKSEEYVSEDVKKDEFVMLQLEKIASKGFSPSSLAKYVRCPMKFYFSKILEIENQDIVEEELEANTFGTIVHACLERLYMPLIGKELNLEIVDNLIQNFLPVLEEEYKINFGEGDILNGKNRLLYEISKRFISRFFENEKRRIIKGEKISVVELEKRGERSIDVDFGTAKRQIRCIGSADRIDLVGNCVHIWDYKTGKVDIEITNPAYSRDLDTEEALYKNLRLPKFEKSFQLMMYLWIFSRFFDDNHVFSSGIIALKNNEPYMLLEINDNRIIANESIMVFESVLKDLLHEIFDENLVFNKTEVVNDCKYCEYKNLCNR